METSAVRTKNRVIHCSVPISHGGVEQNSEL